eukprot:CAMPEP_0116545056 /NCGR_PEP_ID=MMETSP0397-20121206/2458_1 /TAXON_ID=216820 /ORGANISM="Cyclophora tenuis, Strain ECT3854" /LENGTH=175 /DNA_ID=CAMNT_0004069331 /DNA_START=16 /DNA_END=543 /DNA_ORIENTATION=-
MRWPILLHLAVSLFSTTTFAFSINTKSVHHQFILKESSFQPEWVHRLGHPLCLANQSPTEQDEGPKLPMLLDPGTKGGALFLGFVLFLIPLFGYNFVTSVFGVDEIEAGKWIGVGFTFATLVLWVSTYIFRVATKDMTYAKQLKDYENAVIAKRLEELDEDEVQALVEDIERDEF